MSLRTKIQQIAQETATAVVGQLLSQQTTGLLGNLSTIVSMSTDSLGNRTATVQDNNGNLLTNIYISSDRPLGVGDTVAMLSSQIAQ